ncbi:hypothetical protein BJV74DRAFT_887510 [Russula compacta]|nr:hypothetical protein BJV74DRAFT_887510 [Russula compacta]
MLSRFSSLFVYVVAGLVISAAATPAAPPSNYNDGSKSLSYPGSSYSSPPTPPKNTPYPKPDDGKKNPPYPKPDDKVKSYDDGKYNGQCSVGKQQCCNQFTEIDQESLTSITALLGVVTSFIGQGGTVVGSACSPLGAEGDACTAQTMCCQDDHFEGALVFGCQNLPGFL